MNVVIWLALVKKSYENGHHRLSSFNRNVINHTRYLAVVRNPRLLSNNLDRGTILAALGDF